MVHISNYNSTLGITGNSYFYNNRTISGETVEYNDLYNAGTTHLNAGANEFIRFDGTITGAGTLSIGDGYNSSTTGGKYIFANDVAGNISLNNGAQVKFGRITQADGSSTVGRFNATSTTVTGTGNVINSFNSTASYKDNHEYQYNRIINLGNVTFNSGSQLVFRPDANYSSYIDTLKAGTVTGGTSNSILIDAIGIYAESGTLRAKKQVVDANLKDYVTLDPNYKVFDNYYKDAYTVTYTTDANGGYLNFTANTPTQYNMAGFISQDATGTTYTLDSDEPTNGGIGAMAGSNNSKTINAGSYMISGIGKSGATVAAGQTLTVNGGIWDGFARAGRGAVFTPSENDSTGRIKISDAIFTNNKATGSSGRGGAVSIKGSSGDRAFITDSTFINNSSSVSGGAVLAGYYYDIFAQTKDSLFENNSAGIDGGAIHANGEGTFAGQNGYKLIFKNNTAGERGGAIYFINDTHSNPITDAIFKFNTAGLNGGAIYNASKMPITANAVDMEFTQNRAANVGGAIVNAYNSGNGIMSINATGGDISFNYNTVEKSTTGGAYGGAVYNIGTLNFTTANDHKITFTGNSVTNTGSFGTSGRAWGGAIANNGGGAERNTRKQHRGRHAGARRQTEGGKARSGRLRRRSRPDPHPRPRDTGALSAQMPH